MDETTANRLRERFRELAEGSSGLSSESIAQYWKFYRRDQGLKGPLLYISRSGRRVVHIKGTAIHHPRWELIPDDDPKHVGTVYELRIEGDADETTAAFEYGLDTFLR